jgi:UDP-N-acetylmuramoyl-tripeptide--D-alanyl-D-alanine ligase
LTPIFGSCEVRVHTEELTLSFFANCLGAPIASDAPITRVVVDSREVSAGSLFVALPGERVDGHDFVAQAAERGAVAAIVQRPVPAPLSLVQIVVPSSLDALRKSAGAWRQQLSPRIVVVAGSVGKTTTKALLAALLTGHFGEDGVLCTEGSQNGYLGIPLTLLRLRPHHRVAVVEVGIDQPGAMFEHLALLAPHAALVTAVAPEHLDGLGSMESVVREESLALAFVAARGGLAHVNLNDPHLEPWARTLGAQARAFSLGGGGRASTHATLAGEPHAPSLAFQRPASFVLPVPLPGVHNAQNLVGAASVAMELGCTPEELTLGLSRFRPEPGRSRWQQRPNGAKVLCDFYNASPASVRAALAVIADTGAPRRVVFLGDMLELSTSEEALHRDLASALIEAGITHAALVGPRMAWLADELRVRSAPVEVLSAAELHADILARALPWVGPHTAALIKGSRSMKMERVWEALSNEQ